MAGDSKDAENPALVEWTWLDMMTVRLADNRILNAAICVAGTR